MVVMPGTRIARSAAASAVAAAVAVALSACGPVDEVLGGAPRADAPRTDVSWTPSTTPSTRAPAPSPSAEASSPTSAPTSSAALDLLATLPVKGRAPKTGYDRALFGQAWSDDVDVEGGHNGCDTRNDVLRRDLTSVKLKPRTRDCVVLSGVLDDPYTGKRITFVRGNKTSNAVQIDHVVALSDAWQKGAQLLSTSRRVDFANDPLNLQAVDGPTNQRKGAGDAATWLPPSKRCRCTYVSRQVAVKARYGLWVTRAERDAIKRVLADCR